MSADDEAVRWLRELIDHNREVGYALETKYQQLENAGLIKHVVVHRFRCRKGCTLATVVRLDNQTIARTEPYKLARRKNLERSVESARRQNTLDGDRWWPGHTVDVDDLAKWGTNAGIDMNCRHGLRTVPAADILAACDGAEPGHPNKPTLL